MDAATEATRLTSFATLGALTTAQRLAGSVLEVVAGADPGRVAEETLSLVAVTSARAASVGLSAHATIARLVGAEIAQIPFRYHDYLVGEAMLSSTEGQAESPGAPVPGFDQEVARVIKFYDAHFAHGQFPGERQLADKLELWMGRVIPPRTGVHPTQWLERVDAIGALATHNRIVLGYCRKVANEVSSVGQSDTAT